MTETVVTPLAMDRKRAVKKKPPRQRPSDPERDSRAARAMVVQNFNEHRRSESDPVLSMDTVQATDFVMTHDGWQVTVETKVVPDLLWRIFYSGPKKEGYLFIFKKLASAVIPYDTKSETQGATS